MKIQDLLSQYLYQQKTLSLPGLGVFELDPNVNIHEEKEEGWPADTITYKQDRNATVSDHFLAYLVQHTGKMKPLAMSDLESYLSNGTQLLNIGKPFPLTGIGLLSKTTQGDFVFEQGTPFIEKTSSANMGLAKDKTVGQPEKDIDFSHIPKKSSKKLIILFGSLIGLVLIGWAIYIYLGMPKKEIIPETTESSAAADTVATTPLLTDNTTTTQTDSLQTTGTVPVAETSFVLLIGQFNNQANATKRLTALKGRGHQVELQVQDSAHYNLLLKINKPLSDTSVVKDSLLKYYLWKSTVIKPGN